MAVPALKCVFRYKPLFKKPAHMTIAVIDDEEHATNRVLALLEPYKSGTRTACFDTAEAAITGIEELRPDVVFLDVQLRDKTGFDVLASVAYRNFCLIFTTAHEQYAIDAFRFSAIDYLLKPIVREAFEDAMRKVFDRVRQNQLSDQINVLLSHISKENTPKKISLPFREGYQFLNIDEIVRCEADVNYTHIYTSDGRKHTVSKSLKYFEGLLTSHNFFRIHNSHLINLNCITGYTKSGYVTLSDATRLEISIRRKEEFLRICNTL
jgi:two-component system LytT family response regulator